MAQLATNAYDFNQSPTTPPSIHLSINKGTETPTTLRPTPPHDIYDKFSSVKKRVIVVAVAYSALLAPFSSASFLPSIPDIAHDLHTNESVVNYTVAIYLACIGIAPLAWAPYATIYGRRPIYLVSLPIFVAGSIGVALSHSLLALILTRTVQGIGASSVLSVGAGTIGDVFRPTERGRAMAVFYGGALLGPALAPVVAGLLTEYAHGPQGSWRAMQWLLACMGVSACLFAALALPETIHVRGIEKIISERRIARGIKTAGEGDGDSGRKERWVWVWMNPLRPVQLLRFPNVLAISLNSSFVLLTTYALLVPLTYTLGPRYGITNAAILGTLYLAPGFGNIVGSRIAGYFSDRAVRIWIQRRGGERVPEDRLRASIISGGIVVPLSVLATGLTMHFWTSAGGLALSLIWLMISGVGLMGVLSINNTYLVDVMQGRSAEVIAVNNCMRYLFSAGASAGVLPLIKAIGIGPTNAIAAVISWIGFALVVATIKWGQRARETIDLRDAGAPGAADKDVGPKGDDIDEKDAGIEAEGVDAPSITTGREVERGAVEASRRTSLTLNV